MKVFVINLEDSVQRKESIINQLKKTTLDWEIFPAFDGRNLSDAERIDLYDEKMSIKTIGRILSNGEVGCSISHKNVYNRMNKEQISEAVIIEDDTLLETDFEQIIKNIQMLKYKNSVIMLEDQCVHAVTSIWNRRKINNGHEISKSKGRDVYGTYAYYIDLIAAKKILNYSNKIVTVADDWSSFKKYIKVFILKPGIVSIDQNYNSDIWKYDITQDYLNTNKKHSRIVKYFLRFASRLNISSINRFFP